MKSKSKNKFNRKDFTKMNSEEMKLYLLENYDFFENFNKTPYQSPLGFGLEIDSGWHWVVDKMCKEIEPINKLLKVTTVFDQIKIKFFYACFYYHNERNFERNKFTNFIVKKVIFKIFPKIKFKSDEKLKIANLAIRKIVGENESLCQNIDTISGEYISYADKIPGKTFGIKSLEKKHR